MSATQMVMVQEGELEFDEVSAIATVEKWITRYTQTWRQIATIERTINNDTEKKSSTLQFLPSQAQTRFLKKSAAFSENIKPSNIWHKSLDREIRIHLYTANEALYK
ncbi:2411_t:CDS:2, partial [Gigaspora rosea]